jgi:hypothetical protein
MDYPPFYRTQRGETFYCKTLPELIRQLERLNDLLEQLVATQERDEQKNEDGDA